MVANCIGGFLGACGLECLWVLWARLVARRSVHWVVLITMAQAALGLFTYSLGLGELSLAVAVIAGHGAGAFLGMRLHLDENKPNS